MFKDIVRKSFLKKYKNISVKSLVSRIFKIFKNTIKYNI